jgi:hypothetical protein
MILILTHAEVRVSCAISVAANFDYSRAYIGEWDAIISNGKLIGVSLMQVERDDVAQFFKKSSYAEIEKDEIRIMWEAREEYSFEAYPMLPVYILESTSEFLILYISGHEEGDWKAIGNHGDR